MGDAPGGPLPPHQWEALDGAFLEDGVGRDWMDALLEDEPLAPAPGALSSGRRSPGVCFSSKERQVIAAPAPEAPRVAAADTGELRAQADALADCGAVALCAPLLALERADPATRAVALQLVRWFRARLSGVQVPPLTDACRGPPSVPSNRIGAADDMDLCARRPSADWGSATCYGRLEGSPSTRPAPLFNLAKATQAPRPTGYARLASIGEHRRDVFESARADAATQLVSSALGSCARLKAARASGRLFMPSKAAPRQACPRGQVGRNCVHAFASSSAIAHWPARALALISAHGEPAAEAGAPNAHTRRPLARCTDRMDQRTLQVE